MENKSTGVEESTPVIFSLTQYVVNIKLIQTKNV